MDTDKNLFNRLKREYDEHIKGKFLMVIISIILISFAAGFIISAVFITEMLKDVIVDVLQRTGGDAVSKSLIHECISKSGLYGI